MKLVFLASQLQFSCHPAPPHFPHFLSSSPGPAWFSLLLNVKSLAINTSNGNDTHNIQLIKAPASRPALAEH